MNSKEVEARVKEIQEKMKGVKYVIIKIKYEVATGQMIVQHSPKKRYDPDLILGLLLISYQWLLHAFVKSGKMKPPKIKRAGLPEEERTYIT